MQFNSFQWEKIWTNDFPDSQMKKKLTCNALRASSQLARGNALEKRLNIVKSLEKYKLKWQLDITINQPEWQKSFNQQYQALARMQSNRNSHLQLLGWKMFRPLWKIVSKKS